MFLFFGSAFIAFITPYLLFPDRYISLVQLGNLSSNSVLNHLFRRMGILFSLSLVFIAMICFGDFVQPLSDLPAKLFYFLTGSIFFCGLFAFSISRYIKSGLQSQFWKESERGLEMRRQMGEYFKYPLDPGSIPSFLNTILTGALGMIGVSLGALLYDSFGLIYEGIPALIIGIAGVYSIRTLMPDIIPHYYATNSFFREFFGETISKEETSSQVQVYQLWWVPGQLKSHVWAMLVQLDRKVPAGRVLIVGHILVWLLSYQNPGSELMFSAWILFAVLHHTIILISMSKEYAPAWLQRWIGSDTEWIFVRAWIQIRWILLLAVSMLFNSWIFGHVSYQMQAMVLAIYLATAFVVSISGHLYQRKFS